MSREKQIEEMAKAIDKSYWRIEQDFTGCHINSTEIAKALYNAGYRKSTDFAEEIFAEIDKVVYQLMNNLNYSIGDTVYDIAELKKKYTEEEK